MGGEGMQQSGSFDPYELHSCVILPLTGKGKLTCHALDAATDSVLPVLPSVRLWPNDA